MPELAIQYHHVRRRALPGDTKQERWLRTIRILLIGVFVILAAAKYFFHK